MERVKERDHFFQADPRSPAGEDGVAVQYEMLKYYRLKASVPESVQSYWNMVLTVWLQAWFYYPFYTLATFLGALTVEMALKIKFPPTTGAANDRRGLAALLMQAKKDGFLRDEAFPSLATWRQSRWATIPRELQPPDDQPTEPYAETLIRNFPRLRNGFAHPTMHAIIMPGMAHEPLVLSAEIINQLWD